MLKSFQDIQNAVINSEKKKTISIAMADDLSVLEAAKVVEERGIANFLLVGNRMKIKEISRVVGYNIKEDNIVEAETAEEIAAKSVELVNDGKADILMKGHISTPILMKAVLNKEKGLRTGEVLSHVAAVEVDSYHKLMLVGDGGINILPDLETKASILRNILNVAAKLKIDVPKIGLLCPIEKVNPKIVETVDADALEKMAGQGEFGNCIIEGPIAMDVALNESAAQRKDIKSKISGDTDGFLVPNISTGNAVIKSLIFLANAKVGGLVLGAKVPIILLSRSDDPAQKFYSIILAIQAS